MEDKFCSTDERLIASVRELVRSFNLPPLRPMEEVPLWDGDTQGEADWQEIVGGKRNK